MDRPGDEKPRKVVLELELTPELEPDGDCSEAAAKFHISSSLPKHRTKKYSFGLRKNGSAVFNADSPTNVNQATMFTDEDEGDES